MEFRRVEKIDYSGKTAVYQGLEGAYSHIAAKKCLGKECRLYNVPTWKDAMDEIEEGRASLGVFPIENTSQGAVDDNLDLLVRYKNFFIVDKYDLKISHSLIGTEGSSIENIKKIYSHPQALGQCRKFFEENPWIRPVEVLNTALAARMVRDENSIETAAIASDEAADLYGLRILRKNINHEAFNTTRFIVVQKEPFYMEKADRVSLYFVLKHEPGSLVKMLEGFFLNNINLLKIESRPISGHTFEYGFFLDIEGQLSEKKVKRAMEMAEEQTDSFRILGCY